MNVSKMTVAAVENAPVIYTPEDIMAILHICRSSAYKLFNSDGFPSFRVGRVLRVEKTAFEKWLANNAGRNFLI